MTTGTETKERIDIRIPAVAKQILQQAAQASHKSVTEFLLHHGLDAASRTLADRQFFELDDARWDEFQSALERPVTHRPKLKKLLSEKSILES